MQEGKTVPIKRPTSARQDLPPAGLLQFSPLLDPPAYRVFPLEQGTSTLGRNPDSSLCLPYEGVSRTHARLTHVPGSLHVLDLGSANGVIVNGQHVREATLLGGEVLRFGDCFLRFMTSLPSAVAGPVPVYTQGMISGPCLDPLRQLLTRAADTRMSMLILGETGTGKEVTAAYVHRASPRRDHPFVAVNCAALPATMVEAELFGHVKGSFTGATSDAPGLFRQADGGTLLLDEIGDLPFPMQAKLLRVLQDRQVRPVGSPRSVEVDVRVLCATNRDLGALVRQGSFRPDLYARIAELSTTLPPLRDRIEDLPLLATHFIAKHAVTAPALSPAAIELLCTRRWPLNVRGLESAIRRALLHAGDASTLEPEHFPDDELDDGTSVPSSPSDRASSPPPSEPQHHARALRIVEALRKHEGNAIRAAEELGISRSQLYRRARKFGIDVGSFKP
jgi:transcriptional regulator with GAF, ATPase, and Fis domain